MNILLFQKILIMDKGTKSFPEYLFPKPESEHDDGRQLFADFGSIFGVNILHNGNSLDVCCQHARNSDLWDRFCSTRPTLPVIGHNECECLIIWPKIQIDVAKQKWYYIRFLVFWYLIFIREGNV